MSVATQLSPGHQRLQALVGAWRGEETMSATQWAPAGTATSEVVAEAEFGGLFVSQHHRQTRDGRVSFETHNMFGFDPSDGSFKLWQFDSMGFVPPSPASGAWDGNTLTLTRSSPRGSARSTYIFDDDDTYRMTLQFQPPGDEWQAMADGVYRRIVGLTIGKRWQDERNAQSSDC